MLLLYTLPQRFGSKFLGRRKFRVIRRSPVEHTSLLIHSCIDGGTVWTPVFRLHVVNLLAYSHVGVKPGTHGLAISSWNLFLRLFGRLKFWEFI